MGNANDEWVEYYLNYLTVPFVVMTKVERRAHLGPEL